MSLCYYRPMDMRHEAQAIGAIKAISFIAFVLVVFSLGMAYQRSHTELVKYCSADGEVCWGEIDFTQSF